MRKVLFATCAVVGWLGFSAAPSAAQELPDIALNETIRDAVGSIHVAAVVNVDPEHVGSTCAASVTGENNESVHPNTDVFITSGNEVVARDIERTAGNVTTPAEGTLVLADTITIRVQLGSDGVFSGGFLTVSFTCTPPPPPPTVAPLTVPPATVAPVLQDVTITDEILEQPVAGTTLPTTGPNRAGAIAVGIASLLAGLGLLAGSRSIGPIVSSGRREPTKRAALGRLRPDGGCGRS